MVFGFCLGVSVESDLSRVDEGFISILFVVVGFDRRDILRFEGNDILGLVNSNAFELMVNWESIITSKSNNERWSFEDEGGEGRRRRLVNVLMFCVGEDGMVEYD